ncbi:universal stress protein [Terrilactibacillus sp. S3-3]|nr:universal stress protein [Terrilactibacillus sp. S3-3]
MTAPVNDLIVGDLYTKVCESTYKYGEDIISKAKEVLKDLPNRTHAYVKEGQVLRTILEQINENDYDLVVIGSRGLSGFKEFLGSVSHSVVQHSSVPVLVIK